MHVFFSYGRWMSAAAMKAFEEDKSLKETILSDPKARAHLTEEEVENAMNPKNHLGLAVEIADRILSKYTKRQRKTLSLR